MRIAIASGKGGTGKTTVATSLARVASREGRTVAYIDCDVEEPNGHLFLRPDGFVRKPVTRPVPRVDDPKCTFCSRCAEICQYSAILPLGSTVLVYAELCHGCGGCSLVCPAGAITEIPREIGTLEMGRADSIGFVSGLLNVGEAMSTPLIRKVKDATSDADLIIIDAPPGTSCPVIESVRGVDAVLLVTEPTPFGLNDLRLAVDVMKSLKLPLGVVVNRADAGNHRIGEYCESNRIPILGEIPDDRRIAEAYSRGELAVSVAPEYFGLFRDLLGKAIELAASARNVPPADGRIAS